jgi:hypothetical protein
MISGKLNRPGNEIQPPFVPFPLDPDPVDLLRAAFLFFDRHYIFRGVRLGERHGCRDT